MSAPTHKISCAQCGASVELVVSTEPGVTNAHLEHEKGCQFMRAYLAGRGQAWVAAHGYPVAVAALSGQVEAVFVSRTPGGSIYRMPGHMPKHPNKTRPLRPGDDPILADAVLCTFADVEARASTTTRVMDMTFSGPDAARVVVVDPASFSAIWEDHGDVIVLLRRSVTAPFSPGDTLEVVTDSAVDARSMKIVVHEAKFVSGRNGEFWSLDLRPIGGEIDNDKWDRVAAARLSEMMGGGAGT